LTNPDARSSVGFRLALGGPSAEYAICGTIMANDVRINRLYWYERGGVHLEEGAGRLLVFG
jgi:hypothetical protein